MAKKPTKTTAAPRRPAARKTAETRTREEPGTPSPNKAPPSDIATIKIDPVKHGGQVRGAVNGMRYTLDVGKEVQVSKDVLNALRDSHVEFSIVTPLAGEAADEGSSAASTLEHTAFRAEAPGDGAEGAAEDHATDEAPELKQSGAGAAPAPTPTPAPAPTEKAEEKPAK